MTNERQPQVINRAHADQANRNFAAVTEFLAAKAQEAPQVAQTANVAQPEPVVAQAAEPAPVNEFGTAWPTAEPVAPAWSTEAQTAPASVEPTPAATPAASRRSRLARWFERAQDAATSSRAAHLGKAAVGAVALFGGISAGVAVDLSVGNKTGNTATAQELSTTPQTSTTETTTSTTPSTTETTTDEQKAAKRLADRKANMAEAKNETKSVSGFVDTLETTKDNYKRNIHLIFDNRFGKKKLNHTSTRSAMSSILYNFEAGKIGPRNGAEMLAMSAHSSDAFAAKFYNDLHGIKGTKLPKGTSIEEARKSIERAMTLKDTQFVLGNPEGTFMNHGQTVERGVFQAGLMRANGNHEMLIMKAPGYKKVYVKTSNGCFNLLNRVKVSIPESVQTSVTSIPGTTTTTTTTVSNPQDRITVGPGSGSERDQAEKGPGQGSQPQRPGGDKPGGDKPGGDKPKDKADEKDGQKQVDHGGRGDNSDKPGQGDPGQGHNESGYVEGETPPATPAPQPTPAPLPTPPETRPPEAPAVESPIPAPAGPGTPGAGSEKPTPTTPVEIN